MGDSNKLVEGNRMKKDTKAQWIKALAAKPHKKEPWCSQKAEIN